MPPAANESEGRARRWFWQSPARDPSGDSTESQEGGAFVSYPTNRVVGTIAAAANAEGAVEALLRAGFEKDAIEVFQGEKGLHRLDPTRADQGLLAQFQQRFIQSVGDYPELSLKRHAEDLRAGKIVVMVLAKKPQQRNLAADILGAHGAEFIGYYGRWHWESLAGRQAAVTTRDPAPGQMYEAEVAGVITRIRFQSKVAATISGSARGRSNVAVVPLRPGIKMLSWKDEQGLAVVHVHDYENGRVFAVLAQRDGTLRNLTGTVRRLT